MTFRGDFIVILPPNIAARAHSERLKKILAHQILNRTLGQMLDRSLKKKKTFARITVAGPGHKRRDKRISPAPIRIAGEIGRASCRERVEKRRGAVSMQK